MINMDLSWRLTALLPTRAVARSLHMSHRDAGRTVAKSRIAAQVRR